MPPSIPTPAPAAFRHPKRLLILTFTLSFATILLERGLYFFTNATLDFTPQQNLWLAMLFGISYVVGAMASHPVAHLVGEKRLLSFVLLGMMALHGILGIWHTGAVLVVSFGLVALSIGLLWPVVESYVHAGRDERQTLKVVGRFNISWSLAVPLGLALVGPILDSPYPSGIFWLALILLGIGWVLILPLDASPAHLADDHLTRPPPALAQRYTALLNAARWTMLGSYVLMFLIAPLIPGILQQHGVSVEWRPALSSLLDAMRFGTFFALGLWTAWHGRGLPLAVAAIASPLGFVMVIFGPNLPTVLIGEIIFGGAAGMCYYAALYYAMVVKNASVNAGGAHEALIGGGFAIGPMLGLLGYGIAERVGGYHQGMALGVGPMIAICLILALRPLIKLWRRPAADASPDRH